MNPRPDDELSPRLAEHLDAARTVPEAATEAAQRKLLARVVQRSARTPLPRWLAVAAAASLAVVALLALPLLRDDSQAFAAVQRHFQSFRSLSMRIEQHLGGQRLQVSTVWTDAQGRVRTDVGEQLSVLIDPVQQRVVTLLHGPRRAVVMPLAGAAARAGAELDWLEELRRFQGQATRLREPRLIDGRTAYGWSLDLGGQPLVLWADAQGLPVAMEHAAAGGLELRYRFEFDGAPPPGGLDAVVPAGYEAVTGADD